MSGGVVTISTHVLDISIGMPAADISVRLEQMDASGDITLVMSARTNADGRVPSLVPEGATMSAGICRLTFEVGEYFEATGREAFYPRTSIDFIVGERPQHYHVPLLLSPFGYSTYRGS